MNPRKVLERARNNPRDVRDSDFVLLAEAFGSRPDRRLENRRIYQHPQVPVHLNIKPDSNEGEAVSGQTDPS